MPWGIRENFCTPGGAQGANFGVSEGPNCSFDFCTFLVPIPVSSHTILRMIVCKNFHTHIFAPALVRIFTHSHIHNKFLHMIALNPACVWMCNISHSCMCVNVLRGVINGKAGKAAALPKFSDTLTLSQPRWANYAHPLALLHLKNFCDYAPVY